MPEAGAAGGFRAGEVQGDVFEKYRIRTYKEAGWKPYVIAAMILTMRFKDPAATIEQLVKRAQQRIIA